MTIRSTSVMLPRPGANVLIDELPSGRRRIVVEKTDPDLFVHFSECETDYPMELIQEILDVKGPSWLCDEIARDESTEYTGAALKWTLLAYAAEERFQGARILDFGCGAGASACTLARMFPSAHIVGVELEPKLLGIAASRTRFYGYTNVQYHLSPSGDSLPSELGNFDHIIMTGVYEHLLPKERQCLLPKLWSLLNPEGILFLHETPYRYFPIETHTTGGLPLINYLPDRLALVYARHFSKLNLRQDTWKALLRKGLRGGSLSEIRSILEQGDGHPILLAPSRFGLNDRIDLWYASSPKSRHLRAKRLIRSLSKTMKRLTRIEVVPYLELAFQKIQ